MVTAFFLADEGRFRVAVIIYLDPGGNLTLRTLEWRNWRTHASGFERKGRRILFSISWLHATVPLLG